MGTAPRTDLRYSYKDYLTWGIDERWELIEGRAYDMTPGPSRLHQGISMQLARQFANYLADKPSEVYAAPFDVRFPEHPNDADEQIATVVQPDLVVVCDHAKLDDRGCKGAPDLVVEILSPETGSKDLKEKFRLYERAGVKEYWIVDPAARTVMVFAQTGSGLFGRPETYAGEDRMPVGLFPDLLIDVGRVFRR